MRVVKLDRRHTGWPDFKFHIEAPTRGEHNFHALRAWCWNTWGASKSVQSWMRHNYALGKGDVDTCQNPNWCWLDDETNGRFRILFKEKEDAAWFRLSLGI